MNDSDARERLAAITAEARDLRRRLRVHEWGHPKRRFTSAEARAIREAANGGMAVSALARMHGVSVPTMRVLIAGETYKEAEAWPARKAPNEGT